MSATRALAYVRQVPGQYEYDVAFSFAGEDREIARRIAAIATANGLSVFIDEHHLWQSWGKDLAEYLGRIYDDAARYCVVLVSNDYCQKSYTIHERRTALARALRSREEYVLPVLLDDSWLPGLPRTTAYLDLRQMTPDDVGRIIVRKVRAGDEGEPVILPDPGESRIRPVDDPAELPPPSQRMAPTGPVDFALVKVAEECQAWEGGPDDGQSSGESTAATTRGWKFEGGSGYYEDPIFDITILNRSDVTCLLSAVGVVILGASFQSYMDLGGGAAEPLELHRIYQLPLPDVWAALASGLRASGRVPRISSQSPRVDMQERAVCRLPDPVLVGPGQAYRFGLHLFDYTALCPTNVELVFLAVTDQGEALSQPASLRYLIGSQIEPLQRYQRLLYGESAESEQARRALTHSSFDGDADRRRRTGKLAYLFWEQAGRPEGRDQEFWELAEQELGRRTLREEELRAVHVRPI